MWRGLGKRAEAILGIDQQGTSREALSLALALFDSVYVTQAPGVTFHPKLYLFRGDYFARALVGSNNLTVGGTEKNFEAAIDIELDLPEDADTLATLESSWTELLPSSCPATRLLTPELLERLVHDGLVIPEKSMQANAGQDARLGRSRLATPTGFHILPESPLPKELLPAELLPISGTLGTGTSVRGFAIQIKPHRNGEIFLSRTAVLQNPDFFGWPFTGQTTPKKPGNPSYPQLEPDPIVNIAVFGGNPTPILILDSYPLNTVHYAPRSEIRVTASQLYQRSLIGTYSRASLRSSPPEPRPPTARGNLRRERLIGSYLWPVVLVGLVPDYSVMIMEPSVTPGVAYEITVHTPTSPEYAGWVDACNQTMPSGGKTPRKFGWF